MITELYPQNVSRIDKIGVAFASEAKYPGGWDLTAFLRLWEKLLDTTIGKIFIVEENGEIVGALGAAFTLDPYSGQFVAVEQFWYVLPTHRKTRVGMDLYQAFIAEAQERKVKRVVMVHLAELTPASLQKFYEKEGFRLAEQTFWKEL